MNWIDKKIELPQDEKGNYLMTKEAINVLKKSSEIVARYDTRNINMCFLRCIVRKQIEGEEIKFFYDMPINIYSKPYNTHFNFVGHMNVNYNGINPLIELLKENSILKFEMYKNAGTTDILKSHGLAADKIYYHLFNGKKEFRAIFDEGVREENSIYRIVNVEQWTEDYNGL